MGQPLYMRSVIDRNVVMWRITVNVCAYMHPHWRLLYPLCSWPSYGSE